MAGYGKRSLAYAMAGNSDNAVVVSGIGGSTNYGPASGSFVMAAADVSAGTRSLVPRAGTVRNLYVRVSVDPGNTKTCVYTVMLNGVATALTCTITGNGTTSLTASDTTHSFAVVAWDEIGLRLVLAASSTDARHGWAMEVSF